MQEYFTENQEYLEKKAELDHARKIVARKKENEELRQEIKSIAEQNNLDPHKVQIDTYSQVLFNHYDKGAKDARKTLKTLKHMVDLKEEKDKIDIINKSYMQVLKIPSDQDITRFQARIQLDVEETNKRLKDLEKIHKETHLLEKRKQQIIEYSIEANARHGKLFKNLSGLDVHGVPIEEGALESAEIAGKLAELKAGNDDGGDLSMIETKISRNKEIINDMLTGTLDKLEQDQKELEPLVKKYNETLERGKLLQPAMLKWLRGTKLVDNRKLKNLETPGPKQFLKTTKKFREVLELSQKTNAEAFDRGFELMKEASEIYAERPYLRAIINLGGNNLSRIKLVVEALKEFYAEGKLKKGFGMRIFEPTADEILRKDYEAVKNGEDVIPFDGPVVDFPYPLDRKIVPVRKSEDLSQQNGLFDFEDPESVQFMKNLLEHYGLLGENADYSSHISLITEKQLEELRDAEDEARDILFEEMDEN